MSSRFRNEVLTLPADLSKAPTDTTCAITLATCLLGDAAAAAQQPLSPAPLSILPLVQRQRGAWWS